MSDSTEMVTIEVPLADVKHYAAMDPDSIRIGMICRKALDARKSKYERFMEGIEDSTDLEANLSCGAWNENHIKLMAAAPQLLEALIGLRQISSFKNHAGWEAEAAKIRAAIRAALPKDVADEVLGVES